MAQASKPLIPRNEQPEYAALTAQIGKLHSALVPVRGRINEIALLLHASVSEQDRHAGHVEAALHFVETGNVRRSENSDSLREDHLRLREQAGAIEATIRTKQEALYRLESTMSADALAAKRGDFDEMRVRYVAKLRELDAIAMEEEALLNELNAQGYYPVLQNRAGWVLLGLLNDPQSGISSHVRELARR
jgi:hypothetical protein